MKPSEQLREYLQKHNSFNTSYTLNRMRLREAMGWNQFSYLKFSSIMLCMNACENSDEEVCEKILIEIMKQKMLSPN